MRGSYIKATNVIKYSTIKSGGVRIVTIKEPASVYNKAGKITRFTLKKNSKVGTYGTVTIDHKQYYSIDKNGKYYILISAISGNATNIESEQPNISNNNKVDNDTAKDEPGKAEKPTQKEVDRLLANSNDKLGYAVYFSDEQLNQVKSALWKKIQNYRLENGYSVYKSNSELDSFISKVSSSADNMFRYADDINSSDIEKYLPTLTQNGMNAIRAVDNYKYYGNYLGAPAVFNIKDRNPEHVATDIFNSLKSDPFYNKTILGKDDKLSFGSLGLNYFWDGDSSCVGLVFIEVAGSSPKWVNFYTTN